MDKVGGEKKGKDTQVKPVATDHRRIQTLGVVKFRGSCHWSRQIHSWVNPTRRLSTKQATKSSACKSDTCMST